MTPNEIQPVRWVGVMLIVVSLSSVFAMAHHPSIGAHTAAGAMTEIAHESRLNQLVHGGMIVFMSLQLFALWMAAHRIGGDRPAVRLGLVGFAFGTATGIGAALISGFMVPAIAAHFGGGSDARPEFARDLIALGSLANQVLAKTSVIAVSAGILAWSSELVRRGGLDRGIGAIGVLVAAGPPIGLLAGWLHLDVHGMGAVVLGQAVWYVSVGVQLIRRRRLG